VRTEGLGDVGDEISGEGVMSTKRSDTANPGFDGMRAKEAGLPVDACPYEPSPQRTAWVTGWWIANKREDVTNER
jgi:ribosome modulation factor